MIFQQGICTCGYDAVWDNHILHRISVCFAEDVPGGPGMRRTAPPGTNPARGKIGGAADGTGLILNWTDEKNCRVGTVLQYTRRDRIESKRKPENQPVETQLLRLFLLNTAENGRKDV